MGDRDGRLFLSSGAFSRQTFEQSQGGVRDRCPALQWGSLRGGPTQNAWRGLTATCAP